MNHAVSYRNPAFLGARADGFDARLQGLSRYSNPYEGCRGWSAAFAAAWSEGWLAADDLCAPRFLIAVREGAA